MEFKVCAAGLNIIRFTSLIGAPKGYVIMSYGSVKEENVIDVLRRLDGEIDFARGYLQLSILLELGRNGTGSTVKELAKRLNERSKAVADALRKMVQKNIIRKTHDDTYMLTDHGRTLYEDLVKIMSCVDGVRYRSTSTKDRSLNVDNLIPDLIRNSYVLDAIIAIATSKRGELSLREIADAMGLSPKRAQTYIEMYAGNGYETKIFKKIDTRVSNHVKESLASKILKYLKLKPSVRTLYTLTDDGLKIFRKLPFYSKYGTSRTSKLIQSIFGSLHPRLVAKRLLRTLALVDILFTAISLAIFTLSPLASLAILLALAIVTPSMLVLYIVTYDL